MLSTSRALLTISRQVRTTHGLRKNEIERKIILNPTWHTAIDSCGEHVQKRFLKKWNKYKKATIDQHNDQHWTKKIEKTQAIVSNKPSTNETNTTDKIYIHTGIE